MAEDFWIVQDAKGKVWKYEVATDNRTEILSFNSGKFTDFATNKVSTFSFNS